MTLSRLHDARFARLGLAAAVTAGVAAAAAEVGPSAVDAAASPAAEQPAATSAPVVIAGRYSDHGQSSDAEEPVSLQTGRKIG